MAEAVQPVDPDVDLHVPGEVRELRDDPWSVLLAISAGGVIGALARHGLAQAWPYRPGGFPWVVLVVNVTGCALIGALMVGVQRRWAARRWVRPFLGVGVLGGFTTFSTHVLDIQRALAAGAVGTALLYAATTMAGALLAVWGGASAAGRMAGRRASGHQR